MGTMELPLMSVERSFEAWEEVQRQGQDFADKLTQGVTGLIQSHMTHQSFPWPNPPNPLKIDFEFDFELPVVAKNLVPREFALGIEKSGGNGVSAVLDVGCRIGQAGAEIGACLNGLVQQLWRGLPFGFRGSDDVGGNVGVIRVCGDGIGERNSDGLIGGRGGDLGLMAEQLRDLSFGENGGEWDDMNDDEVSEFNLKIAGSQGSVNMMSSYDSRTQEVEGSIAARGNSWRLETSSGRSTPGNESSSLFLVQLGRLLFIRDTTLLLAIPISKQHLLWYGYDRKNDLHSLCPAYWSKHRRWFLMSMICLNPLTCSFMDLQFPNGQLTYVAGERVTTSAFLPVSGGLLQVQGQYPGDFRFSFSCKNKWGTHITPCFQLPDKSFALGFNQALAWEQSGLMLRPTVQLSLCPTLGGSNPGLQAELVHSVKEHLSLICGCSLKPCSSAFASDDSAFASHNSAFASVSLGRSKWNGNVGSSGIVVRVEMPLGSVGRPAFSVQLNSGIEA
ncbi:hypothetical protein AKJ16_DCAP25073 [Drosera capensis]